MCVKAIVITEEVNMSGPPPESEEISVLQGDFVKHLRG